MIQNRVKHYLQKINHVIKKVLQEQYIGTYLHGSLVQNDFAWNRSDIDLIILINGTLEEKMKLDLLAKIDALSQQGPKKGIELSILNTADLENNGQNISYEFHYSPYWMVNIRQEGWEKKPKEERIDPDLLSHLYNIRVQGQVVEGPPIQTVFPSITERDFLESISYRKENIDLKQIDTIMNLCRRHAYDQTKQLVSKTQGLHIVKNLYPEFANLCEELLRDFKNGEIEINHGCLSEIKNLMLRMGLEGVSHE
ncbi:DUF4111 domain-containing protein [Facklamia sp. DSM 111018]|uniref:DUF4111 domain-containing protein n=1 Tax=Facklamia lactis TaxID=2749967 RepID=A0ABS0LRX5_9LACT|nr:aminoglycoside adenylyltransferase domain-containing protein [Facklamia lactis]MBG9986915.1 DUF4111 domain-containing protein [Facklamia lactis]